MLSALLGALPFFAVLLLLLLTIVLAGYVPCPEGFIDRPNESVARRVVGYWTAIEAMHLITASTLGVH
jgi:hypothetical protein